MDACNAKMPKSHAISRASFSVAVDSRAASEGGLNGGVDRKITGKKSEASTPLKRKRQISTTCPPRVEGRSSSSSDKARSVTAAPERFVTYVLPDDLPTDEEICQQATNELMALFLMLKRDVEMISRLNIQRLNALKMKLQMDGYPNSEVLIAAFDRMASNLHEVIAAGRRLPSFNIRTANSGDHAITGEGPHVNEVKTVARYNTRKLKMGKQVTETSVVVAKKNPPSMR